MLNLQPYEFTVDDVLAVAAYRYENAMDNFFETDAALIDAALVNEAAAYWEIIDSGKVILPKEDAFLTLSKREVILLIAWVVVVLAMTAVILLTLYLLRKSEREK